MFFLHLKYMRRLETNEFLCRQEYLDTLKRFYYKKGITFGIMNGRRRVGKSEILRKYNKENNKYTFLFTGEDDISSIVRKRFILNWVLFSKDNSLS